MLSIIVHLLTFELDLIFVIVYAFYVDNVSDFSQVISMLPTLAGASIKTVNFVYSKARIGLLLESLGDLIEYDSWMTEKGKGIKLEKRVAGSVKVLKIYLIMAGSAMFFGMLVPIFEHKLPNKMWLPYDYQTNGFLFWSAVAFQMVPGLIYAPTAIIIDMFPVILISFLTGIIEELSDRMEQISTENDEAKAGNGEELKELFKCIKIHMKIQDLVYEIQEIFAPIFWAQGFMSTIVLCTTAFSLSVVST